MKATVLLTLGLFLATAPSPESATIREFSANFIVLDEKSPISAAEASGGFGVSDARSGLHAPAIPPRRGTGAIDQSR